VLALIAAIRPIVAKITELTAEIAHRVRSHPDGEIFLSLFKDPKSVVTGASLLADATRHWHPWAKDRYAATRARGHDHPRAIRDLGRAWCRVIWRCWQDGVPSTPPSIAVCNHTSPSRSRARRSPAPTTGHCRAVPTQTTATSATAVTAPTPGIVMQPQVAIDLLTLVRGQLHLRKAIGGHPARTRP
jgi:hypothetical protein